MQSLRGAEDLHSASCGVLVSGHLTKSIEQSRNLRTGGTLL
jgi:hypothetical protein